MFPPRQFRGAPPVPTFKERSEARKARLLAMQKPGKSLWDQAADFGSSLGQSAKDTAMGFGKMAQVGIMHDPMAAMEMGQGMMGTVDEFNQASPMGKVGVVGEQLTGIPFRGIASDIEQGNYGSAAGKTAIPLGLMGLGARGMRGPKPPGFPKAAVGATSKLPQKLLGEGEPRFSAGKYGTIDGLNPPLGPVEAIPSIPVSANMGRTSAASMSPATKSFEALVPERYKGDVTPEGLTYSGARGVPPEPMLPPEFAPLEPLGPVNLNKGAQAARDLAVKNRTEPKVKPKKIQTAHKEVVEDTKKRVSEVSKADIERPFKEAKDRDIDFLAKQGNRNAIKEKELRAGKMKEAFSNKPRFTGGDQAFSEKVSKARGMKRMSSKERIGDETGSVGPGTESTMRSRLSNEMGEVNFEGLSTKLKETGKKVPGVIADAQRAAMLTGPAVVKSLLGAVGGLGSELAERSLTQSPRKTLGDFGKVAKSVPRGLKRAGRAMKGEQDVLEAERHLSKPGVLSTPAIRGMATLDAPFREALESLGLTSDEALSRVLNAKPKSQLGKDAIRFLRRHQITKNIVAPVGSNTSTNIIEQGLLRTPGVNMMEKVKKMDPGAGPGKQIARGALGVGAAVAGNELGEELGDGKYLVMGLLKSLAGPYALPLGLGMAFSSRDDLGKAIDAAAQGLMREAPVRIPGQGPTPLSLKEEGRRRFIPGVIRDTKLDPTKKKSKRKHGTMRKTR